MSGKGFMNSMQDVVAWRMHLENVVRFLLRTPRVKRDRVTSYICAVFGHSAVLACLYRNHAAALRSS